MFGEGVWYLWIFFYPSKTGDFGLGEVYQELYYADIFEQLDLIENSPLPWEQDAR